MSKARVVFQLGLGGLCAPSPRSGSCEVLSASREAMSSLKSLWIRSPALWNPCSLKSLWFRSPALWNHCSLKSPWFRSLCHADTHHISPASYPSAHSGTLCPRNQTNEHRSSSALGESLGWEKSEGKASPSCLWMVSKPHREWKLRKQIQKTIPFRKFKH